MLESTPSASSRIIIVGGGIMGTSSALLLARAGLSVVVLEKAVPGAEASSAAAGILGAEIECSSPGPLLELCRRSLALYPEWVEDLERSSGIDVGYRSHGTLSVSFDEASTNEALAQRDFQLLGGQAIAQDAAQMAALEPALAGLAHAGLLFPGDASVTPTELFRATHRAAELAGVEFRSGLEVERIVTEETAGQRRVVGVALRDGRHWEATRIVVAAGSWTPLIEGFPLDRAGLRPARGVVLELRLERPAFDRVLFGRGVYLVPRVDGRVLVGSTLEFVAHRRGVPAALVGQLLEKACSLVPALAAADFVQAWSNFRPFTEDHLPLLGPTGIDGLWLASGHYRNGILLAPVTAQLVLQFVLGQTPLLDPTPFDPRRALLPPDPLNAAQPKSRPSGPSTTKNSERSSTSAGSAKSAPMAVTYRQAGVDIDEANTLIERIKPLAARTRTAHVLEGIGGFAGLCSLPTGLEEPILVSGTDGVGTKLKVAFALGKHDTIGQDLVAMCVNDIITTGADPLFFLDYFGTGKLSADVAADVIRGIADGCTLSGCALLGGETAELPGMYADGEYDLAGFAVGVADKKKLLGPARVNAGDVILAVASSGLHSNGYSLARRVIEQEMGLSFDAQVPELEKSVGEILLTPTKIYARSVKSLREKLGPALHALCHVTGGGVPENLPRVLPNGVEAVLDSCRPWPRLFSWLADGGPVELAEMRRTFNLGIGLLVVVDPSAEEAAIAALTEAGESVHRIGYVAAHEGAPHVRYVDDPEGHRV